MPDRLMRRQCGGGKREVVRGRRKRWRKRWRKEKVKGKSRRGRRGKGEKDGKMEGWKEGKEQVASFPVHMAWV